jgi:hypothetical protein
MLVCQAASGRHHSSNTAAIPLLGYFPAGGQELFDPPTSIVLLDSSHGSAAEEYWSGTRSCFLYWLWLLIQQRGKQPQPYPAVLFCAIYKHGQARSQGARHSTRAHSTWVCRPRLSSSRACSSLKHTVRTRGVVVNSVKPCRCCNDADTLSCCATCMCRQGQQQTRLY